MNWNSLDSVAALEQLKQDSHQRPIIIFKHSTRCSISSLALSRLEQAWDEQEMEGIAPFFLDLIRYRDVSQQVAKTFGVTHQSPQLLLIRNGECVYTTSHVGISYQTLRGRLTTA